MDGHLITMDGTEHDFDAAEVQGLLGSSLPFWLDLTNPGEQASQDLLRDTFHFHPLAIEDSEHFGQRPKLDVYDGYSVLVVYGVTGTGQLVEVHCFCTEHYLLTVHQEPYPGFSDIVQRIRAGSATPPDPVMVLYRVVDALVDGYFPVLETLDDQIDELEDEILQRPTDEQLGRLFDLMRSLIALRKVVTPQRDVLATVTAGAGVVRGMTPDAERYFRDLYDHLVRISDLVDSYRDLMSGVLDTHLSTVSNRLNSVMKQLTVIATVFLPMSFLTGFFGQNFAWMVNRLTSLPVFLGVGIGLQVVVLSALVLLFRLPRLAFPGGSGTRRTGPSEHARTFTPAGSCCVPPRAPTDARGRQGGIGPSRTRLSQSVASRTRNHSLSPTSHADGER